MDTYPLVSVIVPVYNAGDVLPLTLGSLTGQTYPSLEIIVVNDGSTDSSSEIIDRFAKDNPSKNIKVIHSQNSGAYCAREKGIISATGKYVSFCDAGDYYEPITIETMVRAAEDTTADITVCAYRRVIDGVATQEMTQFGGASYPVDKNSAFLVGVNTSLWNKLICRSLLVERLTLDSPPRIGEDALLLFSIYPFARRVSFVAAPLYSYIVSGNSTMGSMDPTEIDNMIDAWRRVREHAETARRGFGEIIDLAAAIHLGVSAPLVIARSSCQGQFQAARSARYVKRSLDEFFPTYKRKVGRESARYPNMRNIRIMLYCVRHGMIPLGVRLLSFAERTLGIHVSW